MVFNEFSKIGEIWANPIAREILLKYAPELSSSPFLSFIKRSTVPQFATSNGAWTWSSEMLDTVLKELSSVQVEPEIDEEIIPSAN
ncbi:hypothetical protein D3C77_398860 [compost metagenome]